MSDLRISRALVTGASAGIGEEFARQLAARGTDLVLVARREERLKELAEELDVDVEVIAADLTEADDLERVAARLGDHARPVDLLVNNAGFGAYGDFADVNLGRTISMVDLNVTALTHLAHVAYDRMKRVGGGGIINVASVVAFQPNPYGAVYGATKAFVLSLSEALHEEAKAHGVRVSALCPGLTRSEFQQVAEVDVSHMPNPAIMEVGPVVEAGLVGFTRNQAVVTPGAVNKAMAAGRLLPSALTRRVSKLMHRDIAG